VCAVVPATEAGFPGTAAGAHATATDRPVASGDPRPVAELRAAQSAPTPPSIVTAAPVGQSSDGAPLAPSAPLVSAASSTTVGGPSGCGGQGTAEGSQRGGSASAAALLGAPVRMSLAVNDAARTASAAGSPTTTATDPATRPD